MGLSWAQSLGCGVLLAVLGWVSLGCAGFVVARLFAVVASVLGSLGVALVVLLFSLPRLSSCQSRFGSRSRLLII